jgi:hypothetical protein
LLCNQEVVGSIPIGSTHKTEIPEGKAPGVEPGACLIQGRIDGSGYEPSFTVSLSIFPVKRNGIW